MSPREAALAGSREIGFTVISMTVSLVAVFIPILLMGGLVGRLFREFAAVASIAILASGVVSMTLTPMMCGTLLSRAEEQREGLVARWLEAGFERLLAFYAGGLRWSLRHRLVMVTLMAATFGVTVYCYLAIPKGFFPQQDDGFIMGSTEAAQDISYAAMVERQRQVADIVLADPDVATAYYWVGANPSVNTGRIMIVLKPLAERRASATQILARLRQATGAVPGITLFGQARQDVQIGTKTSKTQYQYTLQDPDIGELLKWAPILLDKLSALPQLRDVDADLQAAAPRLVLREDRDQLGRLGITPQQVDDTLYDAFGQRQVATIFTELDQYHVILEAEPRYQESAAALDHLYVPSRTGQMVPLASLARYERSVAPLTIDHQDQYPSVTLSFNLAPGYALGDAITAIRALERSLALPPALTTRFEGSAKAFVSSLASQPYLIAAAILAVYIVLGMLYESFIHPLTILSTLPSAGVGAFVALMLMGQDFSLIALIGIILLVGIVKKNAIMMVDFALERERRGGLDAEAAIWEAAMLRFRPIMMTTMAALLGGLPLALGTGTGAELRRPLGIVIVGGLLLSQVLTLYTTPVVYLYMSKLPRLRLRGRKARRALSPRVADAVGEAETGPALADSLPSR
jgi:multidrug efflux pump subunit AcrB